MSGMMEDDFLPGLPGSSSYDNSLGLTNWQAVIFKHDCMYKHKIMHINYTSYDIHRDEDIVYTGTRGHCNNVMVLALAHIWLYGHPFWYAQVLGIYHVNVICTGEGNANFLPHRLEFLWVRWYEPEDQPGTNRLACISFLPSSDDHSFGFLDPDNILRACHVIPLFQLGLACKNGPGLSCCDQNHGHTDWESYIANWWVFCYAINIFTKLLQFC